MKKKHIVIAAHDGVFTHYTGVGTVIQNTVSALLELKSNTELKISFASIFIDEQSEAFDVKAFSNVDKLVKQHNGYIIKLANDSNGQKESDTWKDPYNWQVTCNSFVSSLNLLLDENDENIIMLHDTVFLYFEIAQRQLDKKLRKTIRSFYIPHSSGMCHSYVDKSWNEKRISYEKACFSAIMHNDHSSIVAVGVTFGQHLSDSYGVFIREENHLVTGLNFDTYKDCLNKFSTIDGVQEIVPVLSENNKIIFSWGRLSQAKGFFELVQAWELISPKYPNHYLVIQAPASCLDEQAFFGVFLDKVQNSPRTVYIDDFSPIIWQTFLRYCNTDVVCLASPMDPNPHTPIEAKLFNKDMNYSILASFRDGIKDSFVSGGCVVLEDPYDIKLFSVRLSQAIDIDQKKKRQMAMQNFQESMSFNYKNNLINFLKINHILQ